MGRVPPTYHVTDPETDDARAYALTPDGVQEVPVEDGGEFTPLAICPGGCHLLISLPGHGEFWGEVTEDAREHWAQYGFPVQQPES